MDTAIIERYKAAKKASFGEQMLDGYNALWDDTAGKLPDAGNSIWSGLKNWNPVSMASRGWDGYTNQQSSQSTDKAYQDGDRLGAVTGAIGDSFSNAWHGMMNPSEGSAMTSDKVKQYQGAGVDEAYTGATSVWDDIKKTKGNKNPYANWVTGTAPNPYANVAGQ